MIRKVSLSLAALAAIGFGGVASASTEDVLVNIHVLPVASVWGGTTIELNMSGANPENSAGATSPLYLMNNVAASLDAEVNGTLPAPIIPGQGVWFFLFPNTADVAVSLAAMEAPGSAYAPAGALVWNSGTLGTSQEMANAAAVGINTSALTFPVVYAANAPGELPLPGNFALTVTYTFAPD